MAHDAPNLPCCIFANEEDVEADPDAYPCEECPVADAMAEFEQDPENVAAWALYHRTVNRFTVESASVGVALGKLTADLEPDAFEDLLERFTILFEAGNPLPQQPKES